MHEPLRQPRRAQGFTLLELLFTVAVAAVLLGIAAPNFRNMYIRNALAGHSNDVIGSIAYARSEAIRQSTPISICASSDGATCSGTWSDGWIIFVNSDGDEPAAVDDGETILKTYSGVGGNYSIGASANLSANITYRRDGSALNTGMMTFCHDGEEVGARSLIVTRLRPRMARDTNGDRIPDRDDGANIGSCENPDG